MFNWVNPDAPVVVSLPFGIYWGVSVSLTTVFVIIIFRLQPRLFLGIVELLPSKALKNSLRRTRLYLSSKKRVDEMMVKSDEKFLKNSDSGREGIEGTNGDGESESMDGDHQNGSQSRVGSTLLLRKGRSLQGGEGIV